MGNDASRHGRHRRQRGKACLQPWQSPFSSFHRPGSRGSMLIALEHVSSQFRHRPRLCTDLILVALPVFASDSLFARQPRKLGLEEENRVCSLGKPESCDLVGAVCSVRWTMRRAKEKSERSTREYEEDQSTQVEVDGTGGALGALGLCPEARAPSLDPGTAHTLVPAAPCAFGPAASARVRSAQRSALRSAQLR